MKHIVFVIGYYYPEAGSTSLCAIKVMNELNKMHDIEITCICGTSAKQGYKKINNIELYRIYHVSYTDYQEKYKTKLVKYFIKIYKIFKDIINFWYYPDMDMKYSRKIYQKLEEIENKKHIDCIVSVYMPKQSISGTLLFKKKHPEVFTIAYFLDTLRSNKPKLLPLRLHKIMLDNYENNIFKDFDKIILMKYGFKYYSKHLYDKYRSKILFLGLPSLEIFNLKNKNIHGKRCTYIGTTYSDIRNPIFAMKVFDIANKKDNSIFFQIYGPSNMKEELINWQDQHNNSFNYHDFINHENINYIYEDADYIVNIGNNIKGVIPGKTFEIVGCLKPIIHFTDIMNDSSLEYINKYPNICIINYNMSIEEASEQLLSFLKKPYYLCEAHSIEQIFYYASPNTVSNLIYKMSKKNRQ